MYPHRINLRDPWQAIAEPEGIAYRRAFSWPTQLMPFEELWLVVGGVDAPYRVTLNRQPLGSQADGRVPFEINITPVVMNQNLVEITCTPDSHRPFRGIIRTVYLEVRRTVHLQQLVGNVLWQTNQPRLQLRARITGLSERRLSMVVRINDQEVHYEELPSGLTELNMTTKPFDAPCWQPGRDNVLQQLEVHLLDPACVLCQHHFMTGFALPLDGALAVRLPSDEPVYESSWLNEADCLGKVVSVAKADVISFLPYLWHHPSVIR